MRIRARWIMADRFAELDFSVVPIPNHQESHSKLVVKTRVVRIELDCLAKRLDSFRKLAIGSIVRSAVQQSAKLHIIFRRGERWGCGALARRVFRLGLN